MYTEAGSNGNPRLCAFVAFFPQLVAGPIERAGRLLNALEKPEHLIQTGCVRTIPHAMGPFKKLVIADNVATISNKALSIQDPSFPIVWGDNLSAFKYADFSAYTDIARVLQERWELMCAKL